MQGRGRGGGGATPAQDYVVNTLNELNARHNSDYS